MIPSKARRKELWRLLSDLAEAGDATAIGWLLFLSNQERVNHVSNEKG